jgi:hypothetical protein
LLFNDPQHHFQPASHVAPLCVDAKHRDVGKHFTGCFKHFGWCATPEKLDDELDANFATLDSVCPSSDKTRLAHKRVAHFEYGLADNAWINFGRLGWMRIIQPTFDLANQRLDVLVTVSHDWTSVY